MTCRVLRSWGLRVICAEATNAFNLVSLGNPGTGNPQVINPATGKVTSPASAGFGRITSASTMRQVQLGARLTF